VEEQSEGVVITDLYTKQHRRRVTMKQLLLGLLAVALLVVVFTQESHSIPAFSRKYKTSCATCHVAFPKLNAFGEAFRRNGYQFPDGGDAEATKEEPVSLGAEGNKKAFPDALWPNSSPGTTPVSLIAELEATYAPKGDPKWDFAPLEGEFEVVAAGTLGEDVSVFGEMEVVDDAIEIERANIIFSNLCGGTTSMFNVKLGKFEPGVFSFSNHRRISPAYGITTGTLGDNNWALEAAQKGIEMNGVVANGRLGYNAGLVEGRKNMPNSSKDVYGHLNYKIGGMRQDGVVPEGGAVSTAATQPWQDNSVAIGGFVYKGTATLDPTIKDDDFTMFGGDVNIWYERLNFIAAVARQHDKSPSIANPGIASDLTSFMAEASYIIYPWLVPLARFENAKVKNAQTSNTRIVSAIQFLIRANVRAALEFNFESEPSPTDPTKTELKFNEFAFGVTFGL
jgi:hypothetical protein